MTRDTKKVQVGPYSIQDAWAAAVMAQDTNQMYVKFDSNDKVRNRTVMLDILDNHSSTITDVHRERGQEVRSYYQALSFNLLTGKNLSDFNRAALYVADLESVSTQYAVSVIACLPSCYDRNKARDEIEARINFSNGDYVGIVGQRIEMTDVEVLKANYSVNYNTYYITGITANEEKVLFSYRSNLAVGEKINLRGSVKAHNDSLTRLNRVKLF